MKHSDDLISELIKFLRFPLIVCVVMIHARFQSVSMGGNDYIFDLQYYPVYCNISFFISKLICSIAVPIFFIFSGYLFFKNQSSFTTKDYLNKLRKRVKTLVIPYIFWNLAIILIYFLVQNIMPAMISGNNKPIADYNVLDWFKAFWDYQNEMPICYQFWFIRDLIVVVLLSPLIYFAIKNLNAYFVALMGIVWLLNINTGVTGISVTAIFFFSFGALFSISRYDLMACLDKIKNVACAMSLVLIIFEIYLYNKRGSVEAFFSDTRSIILYRICTVSLIITCFNLTIALLRRNVCRTNEFLHDSNFFIYAYHTMPLMLLLKLIIRFIHPTSDIQITMIYFVVPVATILFGLLLFGLMRRFFPRFTAFITGSRI